MKLSLREIELHTARVCLAEARARRRAGNRRMAATLLQWAANARRRASAIAASQPVQSDLFGGR